MAAGSHRDGEAGRTGTQDENIYDMMSGHNSSICRRSLARGVDGWLAARAAS
jgi:hypothetical protein